MVERVSIPAETGPQTPGAVTEQQMASQVAVAEAQNAGKEPPKEQQDAANNRPEWLPEKFKSAEDLANAYKALEGKMRADGAPVEGDGAPAEGDEVTAETNEAPKQGAEEAQKAVENAGLDFQSMSKEFISNGELSEATYETLSQAGFPKEMVDSYIAGQTAIAEGFTSEVFEIAGGKEQYDAMGAWAVENMTEPEMNAYDAAMDSGDPERIKLAVRGVSDRYKAEVSEPDLVSGGAGNGALGDSYDSWDDVVNEMDDPRYATSPAYRAKIDAKLARSNKI